MTVDILLYNQVLRLKCGQIFQIFEFYKIFNTRNSNQNMNSISPLCHCFYILITKRPAIYPSKPFKITQLSKLLFIL